MEIKDYYLEQIENIRKSAKLYDEGDLREAIRIAAALRVLFHCGNSESLLTQLLDPSDIQVLSTAFQLPPFLTAAENLVPMESLVMAHVGATSGYAAPLEISPFRQFMRFPEWWDMESIYSIRGVSITRHELVKDAANKDGGMHVAELTARYKTIRAGQWRTLGSGESLTGSELASLRQIAYEVLNSPGLLIQR